MIDPRVRTELIEKGAIIDPILTSHGTGCTYGLNLALAWPLPPIVKEKYESFINALTEFDDDLYLYTYEQTHITFITLIDFKKERGQTCPTVESERVLVARLNEIIVPIVEEIPLVELRSGRPILTRSAGFVPLYDKCGRLLEIRTRLEILLRQEFPEFSTLRTPPSLHSTVLRFLRPFKDINRFLNIFEKASERTSLGKISIDCLLVTAELGPYMERGKVLCKYDFGRR